MELASFLGPRGVVLRVMEKKMETTIGFRV